MYESVVRYLSEIFDHNDGFVWSHSLEELMSKINRSPPKVKKFFKRCCQTFDDLEEYLIHCEDFWVENRMVTLYYTWLEEASDEAVQYFENILDTYENRPHYKNFYGHIGQADEQVKNFLRLFYSRNFKQFLINHPDVFVVYNDDTVALIESEAVNYFQERIEDDRGGWFYMNLRGCLGQAPRHIINFINTYYPQEQFLQFLEKNAHVFDIDDDECVYLTEDD